MKIRTKETTVQRVLGSIKRNKSPVAVVSLVTGAIFFGTVFYFTQNPEVQANKTKAVAKLQTTIDQSLSVAKTIESSGGSETTEETDKQEPVSSVEPETSLNDRPGIEEINSAQLDVEKMAGSIVGYLSIPDLQLEVPILEGTTYEKMLYGATTVLENQQMGKGNYALAAHNMGVDGLMFSSLATVKTGAKLILRNRQDQSFTYIVTRVFAVQAHETDVLKLSRQSILTLITCDKATTTTGRTIVQGDLVV